MAFPDVDLDRDGHDRGEDRCDDHSKERADSGLREAPAKVPVRAVRAALNTLLISLLMGSVCIQTVPGPVTSTHTSTALPGGGRANPHRRNERWLSRRVLASRRGSSRRFESSPRALVPSRRKARGLEEYLVPKCARVKGLKSPPRSREMHGLCGPPLAAA
eukprot:CAMPEP_0172630466 /NCGR_PEP_ID=MMETSP1068-20121228/173844_1 /TAXON_ID=35684 /ORGANISM="Pseudopedinella elastica, Strain CCMP716" /LENGTH=160 /DNA_ID=CAMNT_0013441319 /DNA_START=168 /DNA_END=653 /DNA_ORIENTATION=-